MSILDQISDSINYMEDNLEQNITMEKCAHTADFHVDDYIRIFNSCTGHTPYDYILKRRLSKAAIELSNSTKEITDIAYKYKFNNIETFLMLFRKMFDILPAALKNENSLENLILKSEITYDYLEYINTSISKQGENACGTQLNLLCMPLDSDIGKIDNQYKKLLQSTTKPINGDTVYILSFFPMYKYKPQLQQMLCIEVESTMENPGILFGKSIHPEMFIRFTHNGDYSKIHYAYDYIYQSFFPKSGISAFAPYLLNSLHLIPSGLINLSVSEILIPVFS